MKLVVTFNKVCIRQVKVIIKMLLGSLLTIDLLALYIIISKDVIFLHVWMTLVGSNI